MKNDGLKCLAIKVDVLRVENVAGEGSYKILQFEISLGFIILTASIYRICVRFLYAVISTWRSLIHYEVRATVGK